MDRSAAAKHLACVFANLAVGKTAAVRLHARILITWLESL